MGATNSRVPKVLVSNATAANTGTSAITAVDNDIIVVDRTGTQLADTATITNNKNADVIRFILGKGAASATSPNIEYSAPIQVKNVRKVTIQNYVAPEQHSLTVNADSIQLAANTSYTVKILFHENNKIQLHASEETYTWRSGASVPVAADVVNGLIAAINKSTRVVAALDGANLRIDGKAVSGINATELNNYSFRYFHVALRSGFDAHAANAITVYPGVQGKGAGRQVKDMERFSTASYFRNYTSFPSDDLLQGSPLRAVASNGYNLITIEHATEQTGDLTQTFKAPQTTILALLTNGGAASAKQTALVEKLTSIFESAGVYVSDVVPSEV